MIGWEHTVLRSRNLTYRLLQDGDRTALRELLKDRSVTEPGGFLPAKHDEEFSEFWDGLTRHHTGIAILLQDTLIGYIHVNPYSPGPEFAGKRCVALGFVIGKGFQNRGYGTEMLSAITAKLLERFDCCFADHFEGNGPSRRIIEKCGYRYCESYTMPFEALGGERTCRSYVLEK